jgi:hypothetical protein
METIFDGPMLSYGQAAKDVLLSLRPFVCKAWTAYAKTLQHLPSSATPRNCCLAIAKWHPRDCARVCSHQLRASGCWAKNEDVEAQVDVVKLVRKVA